jgi:hypothetical protein
VGCALTGDEDFGDYTAEGYFVCRNASDKNVFSALHMEREGTHEDDRPTKISFSAVDGWTLDGFICGKNVDSPTVTHMGKTYSIDTGAEALKCYDKITENKLGFGQFRGNYDPIMDMYLNTLNAANDRLTKPLKIFLLSLPDVNTSSGAESE